MSPRRAAAPNQPPPAGSARRLAASLYEALLLAALAVVVGVVLTPWVSPGTADPSHALVLPRPGVRAISFACLFAVFGAYCIWLWSGGRRSLPMRTWGVALETATGARPSPGRAALRYLGVWIGPACAIVAYVALKPYGYHRWALVLLAVNYAWAIFDRDGRFLQDRFAGTRLVRATAGRMRDAGLGPSP